MAEYVEHYVIAREAALAIPEQATEPLVAGAYKPIAVQPPPTPTA